MAGGSPSSCRGGEREADRISGWSPLGPGRGGHPCSLGFDARLTASMQYAGGRRGRVRRREVVSGAGHDVCHTSRGGRGRGSSAPARAASATASWRTPSGATVPRLQRAAARGGRARWRTAASRASGEQKRGPPPRPSACAVAFLVDVEYESGVRAWRLRWWHERDRLRRSVTARS